MVPVPALVVNIPHSHPHP